MRTSRSPTTVMTANGEVRTNKEATEYVKQLDLFVTVMFLEETRSAFLGETLWRSWVFVPPDQLCEDHGFSFHWTSGEKPHLIRNGKRMDYNISNYVPFVVPGISASSSSTTPSSASLPSSSQGVNIGKQRFSIGKQRCGSSSIRKKWR